MKDTKIQWAHHTFNGWWGCEHAGPECDNCYAEAFSNRLGLKLWGHNSPRRFFGDKHWNEPLRWDRAAAKAGERHRVFCSSMSDVLEDRRDLDGPRERLWALIEATPNLDWMLLSKRPSKFATLTPERWHRDGWPPNVWAGTSAGTQRTADVLIPQLKAAALLKASVLFVSAEPLLELVDYGRVLHGVRLLILGGESGPRARRMDVEWVRAAVKVARGVYCAPFVKQLGAKPCECLIHGKQGERAVMLRDSHGGEPSEWAADLRVREIPGRA